MIAATDRRLRSFAIVLLSVVMGLAALAAPAFAQDATPAASPAAGPDPFANLENRFEIQVNDGTFVPKVPGALAEGWYVIDVVNTTDAIASANLGSLPEGVALGDLTSALNQSFKGQGGELPEWWANTTFAGGAAVAPGETSSVLVYLVPGEWTVFSTNPASAQSPASFSVLTPQELEDNYGIAQEATPAAASPVASPVAAGPALPDGITPAVMVSVTDSAVSPSAIPASGQQLVQVTNDGDQVHDLVMIHSPESLDEAAAYNLITAYLTTGDLGGAHLLGGAGTLSPGASEVVNVNLMAGGTTILFSTLPDANGGIQVDNGVWVIFTAS